MNVRELEKGFALENKYPFAIAICGMSLGGLHGLAFRVFSIHE